MSKHLPYYTKPILLYQAHIPSVLLVSALPSGEKRLYNIQDPKVLPLKCTNLGKDTSSNTNCWRRECFWCNTPHTDCITETQAATENKRLRDIVFIFRMSDSLASWYDRCKQNRTSILTAQKLDRFFCCCCYVIISSMVSAHFHACISLVYGDCTKGPCISIGQAVNNENAPC